MSSRFRFGIATTTTTTSNAATPPTAAAVSSSGAVLVPSFSSSSSVAASPQQGIASSGYDVAPMGPPVARSGGYGGGFRRISELRNSNSIHNSSSSLGGGGHAAPAFSLATTTTPVSSSSPYFASPITVAQSTTTRGQSSYMTEQPPATQWAPYGGRGRGRSDKTTPKPQREPKGRGRGRTTTRGGSRGESRTSSSSSRKSLPLRPDGALFEYRWYRKGGHRVLVYDGQEYKGSAAHNMWVQIKAVKGPSPGRQQAPRRSTSSAAVGSPIEGHGSRKRTRSTSSGPSRSRAAAAAVPFPSPQDLLRLAQPPSLQYFNSSFDAIMASAPSWTTLLPHNVSSAAPASRDDLMEEDESGFSSEQLRKAMQLSLEDMKSPSPSTGRMVGAANKTNAGAPLLSSGQQESDDDIETISTTCSSDLISDGDHDELNSSGDEAEEDDGTDDTSSCVSIEPYVPRTDPPATIPQPPLHQPARGPSSTVVPSASSAEYSVASNPFGGLYSVAAIPSPVTAATVASSRPPSATSDDRAAPLLLREPCIDSWMEEGMFVTNEFEGGYAIR